MAGMTRMIDVENNEVEGFRFSGIDKGIIGQGVVLLHVGHAALCPTYRLFPYKGGGIDWLAILFPGKRGCFGKKALYGMVKLEPL